MEMFGPVQWMALSWGWSPTLLPCCRAPSPALITMLYVFSVWYSPCWLSLCATCSQYAREMNVRLMRVCQTRNTNGHAAYPFVSACVLFRLSDKILDLLANHWCVLRFVMRSLSLTWKMPFAAFPSPHHPITLIFAPWRKKKFGTIHFISCALIFTHLHLPYNACLLLPTSSHHFNFSTGLYFSHLGGKKNPHKHHLALTHSSSGSKRLMHRSKFGAVPTMVLWNQHRLNW